MAIHDTNVEKRLEDLDRSGIFSRNIELIRDFIDNCYSDGLGDHRIIKYISTLKLIAQGMDIELESATKKDIERYVGQLERSDKSHHTKHDYKVAIKKFLRQWLSFSYRFHPQTQFD